MMNTTPRKIRLVVSGLLIIAIHTACTPTSTYAPTRTPESSQAQPTEISQQTGTPVPAWVTDFSEPILLAIQDRSPDYQDDFSETSTGWHFSTAPIPDRGNIEIANGVLMMNTDPGQFAFASHSHVSFQNFVLRVDVNFLELDAKRGIDIQWRVDDTGAEVFQLGDGGGWGLTCYFAECPLYIASGSESVDLSEPVTITIVSKGTEFAVYLNNIPFVYHNDIGRPPASGIRLELAVSPENEGTAAIAYDNLSIWDLDPVFSPPTATPEPTAIPTSAPWIADFGTPILLAIQDRAPDFQDDFSQGSSGWITSRGGIVDISNGVLALSGRVAQGVEYVIVPRTNFINFVVKVEVNAQKLISGCEAAIQWRGGADGPGRIFGLQNNKWGLYSIYQSQDDLPFAAGMPTNGPLPLSASGIYSITLISREPEIAVYLNGEPITYVMDIVRPPDPGFQFSLWHPDFCTAEYDNLKVWDLDKLK